MDGLADRREVAGLPGSCNASPAPSAKFEDARFAELTVGGQDRVPIHRYRGRQLGRGRKLFTDDEFSVVNSAHHARRHLILQALRR